MVRGTSSFHNTDDDQSAPSTPRNAKKKHGTTAASAACNSKNPYSLRGLEKFTSVRSELEAKKEKIMARTGSDVTMVRFKYSNSQDWIPIVVKIREDNSSKSNPGSPKSMPAPSQSKPKELSTPPAPSSLSPAPSSPLPAVEKKVKKRVTWSEGKKGEGLWSWKPSYYILGLVLLILICLMVSGRFFAICCTAVCWYLVPLLKGTHNENENTRRWFSKEYMRKLGDKKLSTVAGGGSSGGGSSFTVKKMVGVGVQGSASPKANVIHGKRV